MMKENNFISQSGVATYQTYTMSYARSHLADHWVQFPNFQINMSLAREICLSIVCTAR